MFEGLCLVVVFTGAHMAIRHKIARHQFESLMAGIDRDIMKWRKVINHLWAMHHARTDQPASDGAGR